MIYINDYLKNTHIKFSLQAFLFNNQGNKSLGTYGFFSVDNLINFTWNLICLWNYFKFKKNNLYRYINMQYFLGQGISFDHDYKYLNEIQGYKNHPY